MKTIFILTLTLFSNWTFAQTTANEDTLVYESQLVRFSQFEMMADYVEKYRENRLVHTKKFIELSKEKNTIILDTRSRSFFEQKHVKGAINLPFADFTQESLDSIIPNRDTRILIYCNNNFMAEIETNNVFRLIQDQSFASKTGGPISIDPPIFEELHSYTLALNIPTFINLVGYGYQNVYELQDLVSTSSNGEIQFEGTEVHKSSTKLSNGIIDSISPLVNFNDLQELIDLVKPHRQQRLVSLDQFNKMKLDENTIILDTRSKEMYDRKHIKGAIHIEFSDFTQSTLDMLIGNRDTRILIYCNNNFITDIEKMKEDRSFRSKVSYSSKSNEELTLALNIPTYINLFGYGFENVYELNELVVTSDPRIEFEGTSVK